VPHEADSGPVPDEPDYRFTLANERTFLAWQRTALGLLAAAVAAVQFLPGGAPTPWARFALGIVLACLSATAAATGLIRWRSADRAIRSGGPLPRSRAVAGLAVGLFGLGLLAAVLVVVWALS
jgi:putative membrane protein